MSLTASLASIASQANGTTSPSSATDPAKDLENARKRERHQRNIRQGLGTTDGGEGSVECSCGDVYGAWRAHCPSCGAKRSGYLNNGKKGGFKRVF